MFLNKKNSLYYDIGPSEFVWLVFNSQLVCTDSFHGFVFSCIGNKNVVIFRRKDNLNMENRIENLIAELNQKLEYEKELDIDSKVFERYSRQKFKEAEDFLRLNIRK